MAPPDQVTCPDDDALAAFVERTLPGADRDAVEAHLDTCGSCREAIAHVAATAGGGPRQIGRYRLDHVIGSGGMGVVWQAWDPALERKLAIKLLRPEVTDGNGRARLIREARALAGLQHPNVIAVHDVGEVDGEVFIATELIDGESMDRWQRGRPPAEVIAAYAQAARGLAAAHGLGLVHRDVKPSNILVSRDGRVRVGDFGLATRDLGRAATAPVDGSVGEPDPQLTSDGEVVGTPAYMAPEQRLAAPVDARADQYSLCLALAEALLGARPAAGTTAAELAASRTVPSAAESASSPTEPALSPGQGAPGRSARSSAQSARISAPWAAIARGLAVRPADRFPTLAPLIAALDGKPVRPRRWWIAIAGIAVVAAAAGAVLALRGADPDPAAACVGRRPLAGAWEPATRRAISDGFAASGLPYGADAARAVIVAADSFAADFEAEDRRACEDGATRRQPAEVVRKRAACLGRVRGELVELTAGLASKPDASTIQRAPASARALSAPATCNTPAGLADQTVPADAAAAMRVDALSARVTRAWTLRHLGKLPAARALAEGVLADARAIGFLPVIAEAQQELGTILHAQDDPGAEKMLEDGLAVAAEAHADFRAAGISALLVEVVGVKGDVAAAERQARLARPAIIRTGNDRSLEAVIERGLGRASQAAKKYADAYDHYRRAEEIHAALGAGDDVDFDRRAQVTALGSLDRIDEATRINQQVLASDREHLGPRHPRTISDRTAGGLILYRSGRYADAAQALADALALDEQVSGRDSVHAASLRARLASAYLAAGRIPEAEALLRDTVRVLAAHLPADAPELRGQRMNLAAVLITQGRYAEAEAELGVLVDAARAAKDDEFLGLVLQNLAETLTRDGKHTAALAIGREAVERYAKVLGPVSRPGGEAHGTLGNVYVGLGKPREAEAEYERAVHAFETAIGHDTPQLGEPLTGLGELRLARRDAAGARPLLERAVAVLAKGDPVDLARSRFALARALAAETKRAPEEQQARSARINAGVVEARAALELYRRAGDRAAPQRVAVERWLDAHR